MPPLLGAATTADVVVVLTAQSHITAACETILDAPEPAFCVAECARVLHSSCPSPSRGERGPVDSAVEWRPRWVWGRSSVSTLRIPHGCPVVLQQVGVLGRSDSEFSAKS